MATSPTTWKKGQSGNPGGRPKGARTLVYNVREIMARALLEEGRITKDVTDAAIERLRETLTNRKTVVQSLEFAARLNKEIGFGSGETVSGVTIIFESNIRPRSPRKS